MKNQTKKQTYNRDPESFAIYMYKYLKARSLNTEVKSSRPYSKSDIIKKYHNDPLFKQLIDIQFKIKKEKDHKRRSNAFMKMVSENDYQEIQSKRIETLGSEGLSKARKKGIDTLGGPGSKQLSDIAKKACETLGHEGLSLRSKKGRETLGSEGRSLVSKKRAVTMGKEKLSKCSKKGSETLGHEGLSLRSKKGANFICEWSNGELTKGSRSTAKLKNITGLEIINRVNIIDSEWDTYLKKWNEQQTFKQIKKKEQSLSLSEAQKTICEWSDKSLTKGSKSKSKKLKEGLNILQKITIRDKKYAEYEKKWKETSKFDIVAWRKANYSNKGTKSNDFKVVCPDGHVTSAASAPVYCRNRGLNLNLCTPYQNIAN